MMFDTDVLIIGAGPVGLALAGDLGWRGRRCLVVERGDGSIAQPKMDLVGVRTMEFCRRWGIVDAVEASPYDRGYPQDNVYLTALNGHELGRERFPPMRDETPPPESPQHRERCPQNMFDPILRRFAQAQSGVEIAYGEELIGFIEEKDGITANIRVHNGERQVRARYLVGCDGAGSSVRRQLGIAMQGRGLLTQTVNVIFRCAEFNTLHNKAPGYRYMFVGPDGVWATIVAINGRDCWRMSLIGSADSTLDTDTAALAVMAQRALGRPFPVEIEHVLPWKRYELVAERYRAGRCFLAGDACHLTSPTGGLGMNTGIADAVDLSWKLDATLGHWAGPALLDSYEIERRPVAERITRFSTRNLEIMRSASSDARIMQEGAAGEAVRRRVGDALARGLRREWHSLNLHLGNRYAGSPVCIDALPEPLDPAEEDPDAMPYTPTAEAGCRAPHAWLADGRSTLDLFGRGFVVLAVAGASGGDAIHAAFVAAGVPATLVEIDEPAVVAVYGVGLIVVRPDGYVAWRGKEANDVAQTVCVVTGFRTGVIAREAFSV